MNNDQKIIGKWIDSCGVTWVFNANGTFKKGTDEAKFGVTDTKLAIISDGVVGTEDISISSDGKTLIIDNQHGPIEPVFQGPNCLIKV